MCVDFSNPRAQFEPDVFHRRANSAAVGSRPSLLPSEGVGRPSYVECKTIHFARGRKVAAAAWQQVPQSSAETSSGFGFVA
jgi:hypothetical protein